MNDGSVPAPGAHGGDGAAVAAALGLDPASILDLSASLNPFAPDVASLARAHVDALVPYPDGRRATAALAEALGEDPARLVVTNGGADAIALVAAHVGRGEIVDPEFGLYRRHLDTIEPGAGRWRSNPSNPLGRLADPDDTAAVWDEAFYPLATGTWTRGDDDAWRLGSLTKLWACAGLRLGYVIAPDHDGARAIRARQARWSVNGLALSMVPELVALTDLGRWRDQITEARRLLVDELSGRGLAVRPSAANWVLIDGVPGLRHDLAPAGVVVRDCGDFGLDATVRMAVPHPDDLPRVIDAVDRCRS